MIDDDSELDPVGDGDTDGVLVAVTEAVPDIDIDDVGETDGVLDGVRVCEDVTEGVRDVDGVGDGGVIVGDFDNVGEKLADGDRELKSSTYELVKLAVTGRF